jgi:cyclase
MVFFFGCQKTTEDTDKITVAVSIPPLKSVVEAIAKDHVQIVTLIPPGSSPESYEPSPGILSSLEDSLLYFSLGVPAEEANIKPKALQLNRDLTIINLHEEAAKSYPDLTVEGERDPHVWLSIKRVKIMTDVIKERLIRIDPDHASDYRRNAEDFQKLLDETDETIRETIEKLKSKEFIIYHPALGYFADEYGLTMIAVEEHGKEAGADELVFLDINATVEGRDILIDLVRKTAEQVSIPFGVGGGIRSMQDIRNVLNAGADKISMCTAAFRNPKLIEESAAEFGSERIVLAIDAKKREDGKGWNVMINGGNTDTGMDAVKWAQEAQRLGAGEILLTSVDRDGTKDGYDVELTKTVARNTDIKVTASGGAGSMEHFYEILTEGEADAALAASLFHFGIIDIGELKNFLKSKGVCVREKK